jgi:myo-inositol 2-dehydrogenase/D-chiro-inositol 1-dehydrogenase
VSGSDSRRSLSPPPVALAGCDGVEDVPVAVIGCGAHSTTSILPSLRHAGARLVAVCDLDEERAEFARRRFGAERSYTAIEDLLDASGIDALIIVGPPELHVSAGVAALRSGHHVFVEKPPGNGLADAQSLQAEARAAGKQVMIGFNKRRASAYRLVEQLIAEPEFGSVTSVEMTYSHWPVADLRKHLVDMSIHALDTVRWLLDDPRRLSVHKRQVRGAWLLTLMLEHTPFGVSHLNLSGFAPGVQERLAVTGENALVRVDNLVQLTYVRQADLAAPDEANTRVTGSWMPEFSLPDSQNDMQVVQGYATELIAFVDAVRNGHFITPSIDDGVAAMRLIEAIVDAPDGLSVIEVEAADMKGRG